VSAYDVSMCVIVPYFCALSARTVVSCQVIATRFAHRLLCNPPDSSNLKSTTRCLSEEWDARHNVRTNNRALTFCPRRRGGKH